MSQLSSPTLARLNAQYAHEKRNQFIYEESASVADFFGLSGTAKFFRSQADGEAGHAKAVYDFINDRNEKVLTSGIATPAVPQDFFGLFDFAMGVELETTEKLKAIASEAFKENDLQTFFWVSDLIKEQTEEENITRTILDRIALCGKDPEMIHHYDTWIGEL